MQALEIGHFGLISGFDENFKSCFDQCRGTAAKHNLLTEEVGDGFLTEVGFKHTGASASDATRPCESGLLRFAGNILMNRDQTRNTFACDKLRAHGVTRAFWGDEDDIHKLRQLDRFEMHCEAVREKKSFALGEIRRDVLFIH